MARANSTRVRREVNQPENSDVPTTTVNQKDTAEASEGKVIAGSHTRFIDIVSEKEDATIKQESASDSNNESIPDCYVVKGDEVISYIIVDNGKCMKNSSFIQLFCANSKMIAHASKVKVKTQTFCDETVHIDTIGTTKSRDSFRPDQILHRPEEQTVEKLERWAARDGRASEAADL